MPPHQERITFTETDEVNNPTATYIYSESDSKKHGTESGGARLDILHRSAAGEWSSAGLLSWLGDVFLPAGYPHSVSDDYLPYQVFDSLQAFCSSIAGLLSSRAVLEGVGVGNATATPTTALLLHILQDTSGRISTILFAYRIGTALEPECKKYRLAADVFNDVAMVLDCLSPLVPAGVPRVGVLSCAGVLRALCGVAGGSSKASLSAHFARWGNIGEVNAKDASQETIISLVGMLVGSYVVSKITGFTATWTALIILLILHLSMNYAAVRAVQMTSLNRQRANIVFSTLFESDPDLDISSLASPPEPQPEPKPEPRTKQDEKEKHWNMLTPEQASKHERIFDKDGLLTWSTAHAHTAQNLGFCQIGVDLPTFLQGITSAHRDSSSSSSDNSNRSLKTAPILHRLTTLFAEETYMLFLTSTSTSTRQPQGARTWDCRIILKRGCSVHERLKAWSHGLLAARVLSSSSGHDDSRRTSEEVLDVISRALAFLNTDNQFGCYARGLQRNGWDLGVAALETRAGKRMLVGREMDSRAG